MPEWWWAYPAVGAFVGFFSGLLGIGGGATIVPVLAFIFAAKHFPPHAVVHLALGTAMASILFTAASSARTHYQHGAVNWRVMVQLAPGIIVGTFGGALLAAVLDMRILSLIFCVLIYYLAGHMFLDRKPVSERNLPGPWIVGLAAAGIGCVSSLTATGGAALVIAFLVRHRVRIHEAIGTAAATGWPLAAAGTVGYVTTGLSEPALPPYSIGYVYLPALAGIVIASMLVAPIGARLAHRTPGRTLKRVFAVLLFLLATGMVARFF
jgi:uncharacterized membrane protein YfcA